MDDLDVGRVGEGQFEVAGLELISEDSIFATGMAHERMPASIASSGSTAYVSEHPFGLSQLAKASRRPFPTFRRGAVYLMHLVEFGSSRSQGKGNRLIVVDS